MIIERWIPCVFNDRYSVSNLGNVYDHQREAFTVATPDKAGYLRVKMWIEGTRKSIAVHRAVALSFYDVEERERDAVEVNHYDLDKANNFIGNLEITDRHGNMMHAFIQGAAKPVYGISPVRIIETGEIFASTGQVDRYLGVSSGSVSKTIRGVQPTCRGYTFELMEG